MPFSQTPTWNVLSRNGHTRSGVLMGGGSGLHHGSKIPHGGKNEPLGGKNGPLGVSGSFGSNTPLGGGLVGKGKSPRTGNGPIGRLGMGPPWNPKYSVFVSPTFNVAPTQKSCLYPNYFVRIDLDVHVQVFHKNIQVNYFGFEVVATCEEDMGDDYQKLLKPPTKSKNLVSFKLANAIGGH
jgi:hypothetical protein